MEAEVGAPLFDRRPSGVELTDMGRLVLRHAMALDAGARDLDREIRLAKGLELGELRIGAGPWGGAALVAPVIGRLHARHPRLRHPRRRRAMARAAGAAACPRRRHRRRRARARSSQLDEFEILGLSAHDMVVVGRAGHPLAGASGVTLGDVFGFPLVGPGMDSDAAELLVGLAGAVADEPAATPPTGTELLTIECDSSDVLKRVLVESDALTFMPRFVVDDDLR